MVRGVGVFVGCSWRHDGREHLAEVPPVARRHLDHACVHVCELGRTGLSGHRRDLRRFPFEVPVDAWVCHPLALHCRREPFGAAPETAFASSLSALASSGVRATSVVRVVASEGDAMRFGSAYLVAELAEGSCIVDRVLPWGGSYSDTELSTRWEMPSGAPARLHVRAHRTTFTVLEHEELARGESNVTSEICAQRSYDVAGGRFARVSQGETEGQCPVPPQGPISAERATSHGQIAPATWRSAPKSAA